MSNNIRSKGFRALLATQFLGAFSANAFKLIVSVLAVDFFVTKAGGTQYLGIAGALFILPFVLFSTYAGYMADRFSKRNILVIIKLVEFFIITLGFSALYFKNIWAMFLVLFLTGVHNAFFSPAKYGILPEILENSELSEGNGRMEMWTYLAIILGTASGGYLLHLVGERIYKTVLFLMFISAVGIISSIFIPKVPPSGTKRRIRLNFLGEVYRNFMEIRKDRPMYLSFIGLIYFGLLGGLFQLNILIYIRKLMDVGQGYTGMLLTVVALGVGLGSLLAGRLSEGKIEFGLIPLGAIGLSTSAILLGFTYNSVLLTSLCLLFLGVSGGFYIVPLNSHIQQKSNPDRRGQVLATLNFLSFTAILLASGVLYLLYDMLKLSSAQIFVITGIVTIAVTTYICILLPSALIRLLVWFFTHSIYRMRVIGRENVPKKGGALLVCNHVSYVDAFLIMSSIQRSVRLLMLREIYEWRYLNPFLRIMKCIPISDRDSPKEIVRSLQKARDELQSGRLVCIFAEGAITRTGNLQHFNKGMEHIMKGLNYPIIPMHLDKIWGSVFSFEGGKFLFKMPKRIPYPVTVSFGKPLAPETSSFKTRLAVSELGADAFRYRLTDLEPLPIAFWREARNHPFRKCIIDSTGKGLSFGKALISSVVLSRIIKKRFRKENTVGIFLPPSVAGSLTNLAVSITNKIPVNLNYTVSQESLLSAIGQAKIRYVISSRIFMQRFNLKIDNIIFIEDLIKDISRLNKMISLIRCVVYPSILSRLLICGRMKRWSLDNMATIMFTSGSTGIPKGVMLTHANITSNIAGLYQVFHLQKNDVILGVLPFFHSFGYTATMWFPLLAGVPVVYHMNPLDAKTVGELVEKYKVTILMSTPTFLSAYTRRCTKEQFRSLRIAIVGAEKLMDITRDAFKEKFGVEAMEGYGCTELSPIVSISTPDFRVGGVVQLGHKPEKIGKPIPGVSVKVVDPETNSLLEEEEDGLLLVKGPNVMKGYLNNEEETRKVIRDGWYVTGDIANLDRDGFIEITGRLSRFSKIGGEMVPHIRVEEEIQSILKTEERVCAVTSVPDGKKGERLIVFYTGGIDPRHIWDSLNTSNLPKLWIPDIDSFYKIDSLPILGSGKLDLKALKEMAYGLQHKAI